MPQTVAFWHYTSGESLTLTLYPLAGGESLTAEGGAMFTEPDAEVTPGYYLAEVDAGLNGLLRARITRAGSLVYDGLVRLPAVIPPAIVDVGIPAEATVTDFQQTALSQLATKRILTVAVPAMQGNHLCPPLIRGDSYLAEHGRAIEFSRTDFPDLPVGCEVTLTAQFTDDESIGFSITGDVRVATGTKVIRFQPTSSETSILVPGKYRFDAEVKFADGNSATFLGPDAELRVLADVTRE